MIKFFNKKESVNILKYIFCSIAFFTIMFNIIAPIRFFVLTNLDSIINFAMCAVIIICVADGKFCIRNFNKLWTFIILIFGIMITVLGIYYSVMGYVSLGAFYLLVPIMLIGVINTSEQVERLLISMSVGVLSAFFIFLLLSVFLCPLGTEQYSSITGNPNSLGIISVVSLYAAIYLRMKTKTNLRFVFVLFEGFCIAFVLFSRSRTALLILILAYICLLLFYVVNEKTIKNNLRKVIRYVFIIVLAIYFIYICMLVVDRTIKFDENFNIKNELEKHFVITFEQNGNKDLDFKDVIIMSSKRSLKGIADDNSFFSGRVIIWRTFLDEINIQGHKESTLTVNNIKNYNAHNGYIQVAYCFGVIVGVIYILISLFILYKSIILFIKSIRLKSFSVELCFIFMIIAGFFIESMLSAAVSPFLYFYVMMLNVVVLPVFGNTNKRINPGVLYDEL